MSENATPQGAAALSVIAVLFGLFAWTTDIPWLRAMAIGGLVIVVLAVIWQYGRNQRD